MWFRRYPVSSMLCEHKVMEETWKEKVLAIFLYFLPPWSMHTHKGSLNIVEQATQISFYLWWILGLLWNFHELCHMEYSENRVSTKLIYKIDSFWLEAYHDSNSPLPCGDREGKAPDDISTTHACSKGLPVHLKISTLKNCIPTARSQVFETGISKQTNLHGSRCALSHNPFNTASFPGDTLYQRYSCLSTCMELPMYILPAGLLCPSNWWNVSGPAMAPQALPSWTATYLWPIWQFAETQAGLCSQCMGDERTTLMIYSLGLQFTWALQMKPCPMVVVGPGVSAVCFLVLWFKLGNVSCMIIINIRLIGHGPLPIFAYIVTLGMCLPMLPLGHTPVLCCVLQNEQGGK